MTAQGLHPLSALVSISVLNLVPESTQISDLLLIGESAHMVLRSSRFELAYSYAILSMVITSVDPVWIPPPIGD